MKIDIRPVESRDKEKVELLFLAKNSQLKWDFPRFLKSDDCFGLVAEEREDIIGFGSLIRYHTPLHGIIGRLEDIFVHPEHQGKGCGKKIINELIKLGKQLKLRQIVLTSHPKRTAARRIYQSLGFNLYETGVFIKILNHEK